MATGTVLWCAHLLGFVFFFCFLLFDHRKHKLIGWIKSIFSRHTHTLPSKKLNFFDQFKRTEKTKALLRKQWTWNLWRNYDWFVSALCYGIAISEVSPNESFFGRSLSLSICSSNTPHHEYSTWFTSFIHSFWELFFHHCYSRVIFVAGKFYTPVK